MCDTVGVDCVTGVDPSPKLKVYEATESPWSGSLDAEPSKNTVIGVEPVLGDAVTDAVGGVFVAHDAFARTVYELV